MNNYKTVHNPGAGTVTIRRMIKDRLGFGYRDLVVGAGQTIDLSTVTERETTQDSDELEDAVTNGDLTVIATYPGATEAAFVDLVNGAFDFSPTLTTMKKAMLASIPARPTGAYANLFDIQAVDMMTGGAAQKTYLLNLNCTRPLGSGATGDSNDAVIKGAYSNYAVNDANFIFRGLNMQVNNRDGGVAGQMDNNLGAQGKSGGTLSQLRGLTITAENYGTLSDEFGALDLVLKNEAAVATLEYGLRIRNLNNSLGTAVGSAILVADSGANIGYVTGLNMDGATLVNQIVFSDGTKLTISGDTLTFTNAAGTKHYDILMAP